MSVIADNLHCEVQLSSQKSAEAIVAVREYSPIGHRPPQRVRSHSEGLNTTQRLRIGAFESVS